MPLDGAQMPNKAHSFEIHWNPGHSPDGISIYDPEVCSYLRSVALCTAASSSC